MFIILYRKRQNQSNINPFTLNIFKCSREIERKFGDELLLKSSGKKENIYKVGLATSEQIRPDFVSFQRSKALRQ